MSLRFLSLFAVLLTALATTAALTQPPAPPPPAQYDVQIRYDIDAFRNERVAQYRELLKSLKQVGFVLDQSKVENSDPENVNAMRLFGTVSAVKAREILFVRNVDTILLVPKGVKLDDKATVRVQLELAAMPSLERQRQLADQLRLVLLSLNFKEAVAYDTRGYTRLVGSMPAAQIETILADVRLVPAGWALLKSSLLADLRSQRGGGALVESVLNDWNKTAEGKRAVDAAVDDWRADPVAKKYAASLPLNPADKVAASVIQESLMVQMAHHSAAANVLQSLFSGVLRSEKAPELVAILLRRVNAQTITTDLPLLYASTAPLRVIEVQNQPGAVLPEGRPAAHIVPAGQERIDPELRELLKDASKLTQPLRFEVLLAQTPEPEEQAWRGLFLSLAGVAIEGRLGSLVTVQGPLGDALKLAAQPEIVGVRLPRLGRSRYETLNPDDKPPKTLDMTAFVQLYDKGHRGKGSRVAVVDADFRGWEKAVADGKLPAQTRLLDLTRERNRNFEPDPYAGPAVGLASGLRNAMNMAKAAPEAEMVLIRIDAAAPYMLQNVANAINGDEYRSLSLDQRQHDLEVDGQLLRNRADALLRERRQVLDNLSEDYGKDAASKKALEAYKARQKQYDADERAYDHRIRLALQHGKDIDSLKAVRLVSSGLIWNDGHPVDGGSALSRWFDDRPFKAALWFQAAGDTTGQAWTGLFRDEDGNGVMEFAAPGQPLAKGAWTNELNFLAWQSGKEVRSLELPAGAKVRLSLQWPEAHDPSLTGLGKRAYREPLAKLKLVVLYQPDPEGRKEPADDMIVQFESSGIPQRLEARANGATYEQTLTFTAAKAGRYAVRIEGRAPDSTRPDQYPTIPAAKKSFELRPRLFVETLAGPGRAVLHSYSTEAGEIGIPGDAHNVIAVGVAEGNGR